MSATATKDQPKQSRRLTDDDIAEARVKIREAFAHAGLISGTSYVCPTCQKVHKSKSTLSIRNNGRWKCFSSGDGGDAISLMQEQTGLTFPDAVKTLLGRPTGQQAKPVPKKLPPIQNSRPRCQIDPDVYEAVLTFAGREGIEAAVEYYGHWHIAAGAVRESGARVVLDSDGLQKTLVQQFGMDRLKKCGLVVETSRGKDYFLVNRDYPVIEPHISPLGRVHGMQFRPSVEQRRKVEAHARYAAAKERGEDVAEVKYVPKFLSLAGVDPEESLIGIGLERLWKLPEGTAVRIVEGFKDKLATRTLGHEAYGLPGTNAIIADRVVEVLTRFWVGVAMDGDSAGDAARQRVIEHLVERDVHCFEVEMPPEMDVTDILVSRHAEQGCQCEVCQDWRTNH